MIQHFFHGMSVLAGSAERALMNHIALILRPLVNHHRNGLAHFIRVRMETRIAAKPAAIHFHVSKATQLMVMFISFGAPCRSELANLLWRHSPRRVHMRRAMKLSIRHRNPNIAPQVWTIGSFIAEKVSPLLCRQLQMRSMRRVSNKLIVAPKDIFCRPHILVKAKENRTLVLVTSISIERVGAWALVGYLTHQSRRLVRSYHALLLRTRWRHGHGCL